MSSKFLISIISLCSTLTSSWAVAHQQVDRIRVGQSEQKKQIVKKVVQRTRCRLESVSQEFNPYGIKDFSRFPGLVINVPTIREDARILIRQYQLEQECRELGIPIPSFPQATFSGKLEDQLDYKNQYSGLKTSNINLSSVELDTYVRSNLWTSGYMSLNYDPSKSTSGSSHIFVDRAFIAIGNLSRFPFYASIGQVDVPFGRYKSAMITSPVTQSLGRTQTRAVTIGYQQTGNSALHAEMFGYQEPKNLFPSQNSRRNQWGADIGYEFNTGGRIGSEIGASLISNLADSQGMQEAVFSSKNKTLHHAVQAVDLYGSLSVDPVIFTAEYVRALKSFDVSDVGFENQGACPTAFHTEVNYVFHMGSRPGSFGFGYGHTTQAAILGLPQDRYSIFCNVGIWKDTNFSLEYRHDVNYPKVVGAAIIVDDCGSKKSIPSSILISGLDKSDNVVTARFDLYF
ncbi:LbtU family siderophore porin [Coxiella endosymbiont of Amblyomma sculptum]|uniref:LbtU family siderophore porin n=1 Tax=Coxiella endosymbiont of Amblyomma sculptum TaxID=2487929 RepID=UPI00132F1953|nr:LbtU family siderophore porin [Coxiella endosymbiont of Amblyomma sculptum]QHG92568.1 LbtU family siderophore porin [Coxiella endosymbiont of Amblyomma sculptum]